MNPYQVDRNQAEIEARAKMSWGDSPQEVVKYLMIQGFSYEEAAPLVDSMWQERLATIRRTGITKIVIGLALMSVPVFAWFFFASIGAISLKLFAIAVMVGAWGGWLLLKGIFMIVSPRSESGDVAEK
jgi:predicted phage tail protein